MKTSINAKTPYKKRESTKVLVVHSTNTSEKDKVDAFDVHRLDCAKGITSIGYHFVIESDGVLRYTRPLDELGFHLKNTDWCSVGILVVGGKDAKGNLTDNFTASQYKTLQSLVLVLKALYPDVEVHKASQLDADHDSELNLDKVWKVLR